MIIKKLSIVIPAYNEGSTIHKILDKVRAVTLINNIEKEIIVINDCSKDNTAEILAQYIKAHPECNIILKSHEVNQGKGAAIHTGISMATGEYLIIQDADLEYDPAEYNTLLKPVIDGFADVVYGSRFIGGRPHRILFFWHTIGNKFLTFLSNMFTNLNLTDMETCYKLFRTDMVQKLKLEEKRFGFEPEVTAKISRVSDVRIYEVGISYYGRTYEEGKKIGWKDGFRAIFCIMKYNLFSKNITKFTSKPTWVSYLTLLAFVIIGFSMFTNQPRRTIYSDASGYYLYLPAVFIHQSFKIEDKGGTIWEHNPNGIIYDKYSSGVAYLEAPFFLAAHAWAKISGQEADGYSQPYHKAICLSALFYCTMALIMLYGLLRRYFGEILTLLTLLGIYFGTNLFYYTTIEPGMSHVYNFFLCTCLLILTDSFYRKPTGRKIIALGLMVGFTTLTRPSNAILILVVAFWECYNFKQLKQRFTFFLEQWKHIISAVPFVILPWVPQMFYWKALQGKWLFYSYGNEGFPYWRGEKFLDVLSHPQGGLFLYSPLLILSFIGLILCLRKKIYSAPVIFVVMTLATYIFSSWWAWWFGGSFGHRCFVDFYSLLALPLAYFLFTISKQANWLRYGIIPVVVLMIYISVGLTLSYDPPWDGPQWGWDDYIARVVRVLTTTYWW